MTEFLPYLVMSLFVFGAPFLCLLLLGRYVAFRPGRPAAPNRFETDAEYQRALAEEQAAWHAMPVQSARITHAQAERYKTAVARRVRHDLRLGGEVQPHHYQWYLERMTK